MAILDGIFNVVGLLTTGIRSVTEYISKDYYDLILLALAIAGSYYLWKNNQTINNKWVTLALYTLTLFIILRFV